MFNNAGAGDLRPLHTVDDKLWHRLVDVNLTGTFNGMRAAVPLMLEAGRGAIVNNASVSGMTPTRNEAAYSAAKAGVIALTKSGALEYGPRIRVNCVAPGHVRTPLTSAWEQFPEVFEPVARSIPLGRIGEADEIAEVVLFLASARSSYITGPDARGRRRHLAPPGRHRRRARPAPGDVRRRLKAATTRSLRAPKPPVPANSPLTENLPKNRRDAGSRAPIAALAGIFRPSFRPRPGGAARRLRFSARRERADREVVFDPERDDDSGARRFYTRLLVVMGITAVACVALWPSVTGFAAGPDHDTGCLAIADGWHGDQSHPSDAATRAAYAAYPAAPTEAQRNDPAFMDQFRAQIQAVDADPVVQQANAYAEWVSGPGTCVHESRHRLIMSGIGLGALLIVIGVVALVRRARTGLRHAPAEIAAA